MAKRRYILELTESQVSKLQTILFLFGENHQDVEYEKLYNTALLIDKLLDKSIRNGMKTIKQ